MTATSHPVTLTVKELDLIASALETQRKIFQVQASAGEQAAQGRLNDIKRTLSLLNAHRTPAVSKPRISAWFGAFFTGITSRQG